MWGKPRHSMERRMTSATKRQHKEPEVLAAKAAEGRGATSFWLWPGGSCIQANNEEILNAHPTPNLNESRQPHRKTEN